MQINNIKSKEYWESFLNNVKEKSFLQSWNWGKFQESLGQKVFYLGFFEGEKLQATALIIKIVAKRATFFLCPHGPITIDNKKEVLENLINFLKNKEGASFLRICPIWQRSGDNNQLFEDLGFKKAPIHIHPENNWILEIDKNEEELLMDMRKNTRYDIKKAKKMDVEIIKRKDIEAVEIFNELYKKTVKREKFTPFSLNYLKKEFFAFEKDNQIVVFLGKYKQDIISAAMIIYWQNKGYYHQGASLRKYKQIPASHLLQWEAIREAKKRGCSLYSFWGIAPKNKPNHPWKGITLFKKGFSGKRIEYVKTQDYIFNNRYWFNYFIEKIRSKKRGF
jgi:lipid II:glycine glycyltransferase (peptidoglycan interpeptide bridge formation enzyme)